LDCLSFTYISLILAAAPAPSIAVGEDFKLFVNNSQVLDNGQLSVASGSLVNFEILQTSNLPVYLDPTGYKDIIHNLSGNPPKFSTAYYPGTYNPTITVGNLTKKFQLTVGQKKTDWTTLLPPLYWPLAALLVFIVLFF
jgi:hypothetical protein